MTSITIETKDRVCFWGATANIPASVRLTAGLLKASGKNSGNLFIGTGLYNATRAPVKEYWDFYLRTPEEFDEKFDTLFIPASNFIFQYTDLKDQYNFFSKTKAKIFMFGLGSQLREIGPIKLIPTTERFIRLVAERGTSIGVRGEVTADVMRKLGISNVEVTGCPSMLNMPDHFSAVPDPDDPTTVFAGNFTNNAREHAFSAEAMMRLESALFAELVKRNGYYILQNEAHELAAMKALAHVEALSDQQWWDINRIRKLFALDIKDDDWLNFLARRLRIFFSTVEWKCFMRAVDFSFGTRFHGNVAALLAGRPAYIFCHDYRTLELAQFYKVPHRVVDAISPIPAFEEMFEDTDMGAFQANVPKLMKIWRDFIRRNGFEAKIHESSGGTCKCDYKPDAHLQLAGAGVCGV